MSKIYLRAPVQPPKLPFFSTVRTHLSHTQEKNEKGVSPGQVFLSHSLLRYSKCTISGSVYLLPMLICLRPKPPVFSSLKTCNVPVIVCCSEVLFILKISNEICQTYPQSMSILLFYSSYLSSL